MAHKLLSDMVFVHKGRAYRQGDSVPLSAAEAAHHANKAGVRFEDNDPGQDAGLRVAVEPVPVPAVAYDDMGAPMEGVKNAEPPAEQPTKAVEHKG